MMRKGTFLLLVYASFSVNAKADDADWPVSGGPLNIRYSGLTQITPANVRQLQIAWTYDSHDAFKGSEMQSNPIVVEGVLYATTPKLHVIALNATTGKELWNFDPAGGTSPQRRYRHRGVTVYQDRVFFTHRNFLWALSKKAESRFRHLAQTGISTCAKGLIVRWSQ